MSKRILLDAILVSVCLLIARAHSEPKKAPTVVNTPVQPRDNLLDAPCAAWVSDGAIEGEPLSARIERLETAVRLSKAERVVNGRRR